MTAADVVPMTPVTRALLRLFLHDPGQEWSMGELTRELGFSTHATRTTLGRLIEAGWVARIATNPPPSAPRRAERRCYRLTATGADHARTTLQDDEQGDLVAVLVDLRNAITPLVEDLLSGIRPPVERWLAFVELIFSVIPLCRQQALSVRVVGPATAAPRVPPPQP